MIGQLQETYMGVQLTRGLRSLRHNCVGTIVYFSEDWLPVRLVAMA